MMSMLLPKQVQQTGEPSVRNGSTGGDCLVGLAVIATSCAAAAFGLRTYGDDKLKLSTGAEFNKSCFISSSKLWWVLVTKSNIVKPLIICSRCLCLVPDNDSQVIRKEVAYRWKLWLR